MSVTHNLLVLIFELYIEINWYHLSSENVFSCKSNHMYERYLGIALTALLPHLVNLGLKD